jgi:hypothetical protein
VLNPIEKGERNTHQVVQFHAKSVPESSAQTDFFAGCEVINSGPYVQFASVGKITDDFIEIPTRTAPPSERAI